MKKNERISISIYKPVCKHLQFSITEYHDGYIDEDSRCDIILEKCKSKGCKNKEYKEGITYDDIVELITQTIYNEKVIACSSIECPDDKVNCANCQKWKEIEDLSKIILDNILKGVKKYEKKIIKNKI